MRAIQIGAGKIGRGFLGQLLYDGGYQTTFVDANTALVDALNARGAYPLRLVSDEATEERAIGRLHALHSGQTAAIAEAIVQADLVSVAVGVHALPHLAPLLAAGIRARRHLGKGPLDILLCENQWHAATLLRGMVEPLLSPEDADYLSTNIGLVETVIGRMVPDPTPALQAEDPLLLVAEPYDALPIADVQRRSPLPTLPGLIAAANFEAYEARKLFLHNMGHAALAYLGYLYGYEYIWECAYDPLIEQVCSLALGESSQALVAEYGFAPEALQHFCDDLLRRFSNKALGDTVARVAADPLRKLRRDDRLAGAVHLCRKHGLETRFLMTVIQDALRYDAPDDPAAVELQERRRTEGDAAVLSELSSL